MKSKTAISELIHFIENDMMQRVYTKEQILELLDFKLESEKVQIINAHGAKLKISRGASNYEYWYTGKDYYNDNFNKKEND